MDIRNIFLTATMSLVLCGPVIAQRQPDRFLLPQPDQPFEGRVDTRMGPPGDFPRFGPQPGEPCSDD
jgi:hypothetical protein